MSKSNLAQAETPVTMNGVSVTGIFDTIAAVKKQPDLAEFRFRATNRWISGGHNRSSIQGFYGCGMEDTSREKPFFFDASEPPVLLANNEGANPVEFILHALAGCLTTTMVYHAAARGIAIEGVESSLEGDLDLRGFLGISEEVRKGYREIRVNMRVKSKGSPAVLRSLAQFSPVFDVVSRALPVIVTVETH
ncbi:OsmC family protein [Aestuariivirga sp.]|uniref:OsmC family protein n=1 Tax=Aestuariivirga sp. TaxID=2650926 RepID=UPI00391D7FC2